MFFTSYLARVKKVNNGITPVLICRYVPVSMTKSNECVHIPILAPTPTLLKNYKSNRINIDLLKNEYMGYLNNNRESIICLVNSLISKHKKVCFICYEKDISVCHRETLAKFLCDNGFSYGGEI